MSDVERFPGRIILSRKGFDSSSGGCPSPILPDGRCLSLPIPDLRAPFQYNDISSPAGRLGSVVHDLTRGRVSAHQGAHLDPDLDKGAVTRERGWKPAFGQTGAAQTHLQNRGVGRGDLFLFFGWFREAEYHDGHWRFIPAARDLHILYGWLSVGEIVPIHGWPEGNLQEILTRRPWLADHPHVNAPYDGANAIYTAADDLRIPDLSDLPGAGVFPRVLPAHVLTDADTSGRTLWRLPAWMAPGDGVTLSYHEDPARWTARRGSALLKSVARGQEFVLSGAPRKALVEWLGSILPDHT